MHNTMVTGLKQKWSLFWLLQSVGWTGYALDRYITSQHFFPRPFAYILLAFAITCALRPFYRWLWSRSPSLLVVGAVALFCSVLAGFLWLVISQVVFWLLNIAPFPDKPVPVYLKETFVDTLVHHKPFLFLSWSALYFGIKYWQDKRRQEEQAMRANALAQEAQLKMLRYQLNPHFLFNALNSIQALIRENPQRAETMLGELSEFLRYSLLHHKTTDVPLKDELEAVSSYLGIEKIRFEDKLDVEFAVDPSVEEFRVPCFLMHPLVENAIKYGMQTSRLPLVLKLLASASNGSLRIEVRNTGHWSGSTAQGHVPHARGTGIGLDNVRQRLEQAFPQKHRFRVFERDGWVHAVIEIERSERNTDGEAMESSDR
jgi:two-component system, LytTR family, sensor kinase